jgi:hypothetical protein
LKGSHFRKNYSAAAAGAAMPTTRSGAKSIIPESSSKPDDSLSKTGKTAHSRTKQITSKKRKSDTHDDTTGNKENRAPDGLNEHPSEQLATKKPKSVTKGKTTGESTNEPATKDESKGRETGPDGRPRLTTPDLEFDFDRSQLRDPRPTPGRKARPRHSSIDLDLHNKPLKEHFETNFYIPEAEKPKGRLNALQKDELFRQNGLLNPLHSFHDLYVCHEKGPDGSPTYDTAGFELDYKKVQRWMRPQAYNKKSIVRGAARAVDRHVSEEEQMFNLFFKGGKASSPNQHRHLNHSVKDHVSKDLGIPWHQIGVEQVQDWRDKGFGPVEYEQWWKEPSEVESARLWKMLGGASLRKDL